MSKCQKCGKDNPNPNLKFCTGCGSPIQVETLQPVLQQNQQSIPTHQDTPIQQITHKDKIEKKKTRNVKKVFVLVIIIISLFFISKIFTIINNAISPKFTNVNDAANSIKGTLKCPSLFVLIDKNIYKSNDRNSYADVYNYYAIIIAFQMENFQKMLSKDCNEAKNIADRFNSCFDNQLNDYNIAKDLCHENKNIPQVVCDSNYNTWYNNPAEPPTTEFLENTWNAYCNK